MYILFEHIEDYESPQVNIITINKNINEVMKFLSEKNINHSIIVDNQQIFYCDNKSYILITKETNNFMKQEVIA